ncbi:hypothetical protein LZP69_10655 [Shewanella sp. AS1]|uniref:hypothetical protein n=1 Tax=Shewanella sp. AS1 TaxID=2907626 RepID=UPI001F15D661|nr:hypothetical protein [Shewanella sp. AS1]MCE9679620.1 hypothetical protein [Shewanella sp. AS1]
MVTFPDDIFPTQCDWRLVHRTRAFSNPYNNQVQTLSLPGAYWEANLTFSNLSRAQGAKLHSFVASMRGMAERTQLHDHAISNPSFASAPQVLGGGQAGKQLNVTWLANAILPAGHYIQVGSQLLVLTADAVADAGGACTFTFEPALRASPANGATVTLDTPQATMRFIDDNQGMRRSSKKLVLSSVSLSFVEDIYA